MTPPREDLTNRRFGRLTAKESVGANKHGQLRWRCVCDCGKSSVVTANNLKMSLVASCGCSRRSPRSR